MLLRDNYGDFLIPSVGSSVESSSAQILALKKEMEHTTRLLNQLRIQKKSAEEVQEGKIYVIRMCASEKAVAHTV